MDKLQHRNQEETTQRDRGSDCTWTPEASPPEEMSVKQMSRRLNISRNKEKKQEDADAPPPREGTSSGGMSGCLKA